MTEQPLDGMRDRMVRALYGELPDDERRELEQAIASDEALRRDWQELQEARTKPVVIHYSSGSKPWHFKNRHPYKSYYWKYLKMTPYRRAIYSDLRPLHLLKSMIPKNFKAAIKKVLKKQAG